MDVQISLTKAQKRKLLKGHAVNLKHSQLMNGDVNVSLDKEHGRRLRKAMRGNKGFRLQPTQGMVQQMVEGEGFKDVMRKVNKGVKKAIRFTKNEVVPFVKSDVVPYAKEILAPAVKANRQHIDKAMKGVRERSEKQIEDVLIKKLGKQNKELIQDLVTENSARLSSKASKQLDKLEGKVDSVLQHPDMGMIKGKDYEYINTYDIPESKMNKLPLPVAEAIPIMKGEGIHRAVYLKGKGVPKFLKKVGRFFGKVVKSKPVKKILTELAKQGVASMVSSATGNPFLGEATKGLTGNLVEQGVNKASDEAGEAMGGGVILTASGKTILRKGRGGALFVPQGRGLNISKLQGGKYLL